MKKLLFVLLALALVIGCAAALGETTYRSAGFEYALLDNGDAELIRYLGEEGTVIIPNGLDGHPITAVRGNPFYDSDNYTVKDCTVSVALDHPYLATIDGVLFGMSDRKLIIISRFLPLRDTRSHMASTRLGNGHFITART